MKVMLEEGKLYISAENKDIVDLTNRIKDIYIKERSIKPSLCSERELGLLKEAKKDLTFALEQECFQSLDIIAIHLKSGYDALKRILGEEVNPDLEKEVFSRFCVGK